MSGAAISDVVIGVFRREELSTGLVAIHRAGFGPHARVLDSSRGHLGDQLQRAGYALPIGLAPDDGDLALILVAAPGRAPIVAETLTRAGAQAIHLATRLASSAPAPGQVRLDQPAAAVASAPPAESP